MKQTLVISKELSLWCKSKINDLNYLYNSTKSDKGSDNDVDMLDTTSSNSGNSQSNLIGTSMQISTKMNALLKTAILTPEQVSLNDLTAEIVKNSDFNIAEVVKNLILDSKVSDTNVEFMNEINMCLENATMNSIGNSVNLDIDME